MKRLATVALIVAFFTLPLCAQRARSTTSFAGHAGASFHGQTNRPAPARSSSAPTNFSGRPSYQARRLSTVRAGGSSYRHSNFDHHRMPYRPFYGRTIPNAYPGWINPYLWGYPDLFDNDESPALAGSETERPDPGHTQEPYAQAYEPQQPAALPDPTAYVRALPTPDNEEATTIIFKDGRPHQQIHNYMLTATTLSVLDSHHRDIPVDQIDLPATAAANREAGIDFHVPSSSSAESTQ